LGAVDLRVELTVEVLERLQIRELRQLLAPLKTSLVADVEFVLEEQFQELPMGDAVDGRLVEAEF
jgi:hypothetical protein